MNLADKQITVSLKNIGLDRAPQKCCPIAQGHWSDLLWLACFKQNDNNEQLSDEQAAIRGQSFKAGGQGFLLATTNMTLAAFIGK